MRRPVSMLLALAVACLARAATPDPAPPSGAAVRVGAEIVLTLRAVDGDELASERAAHATAALAAALDDPGCLPSGLTLELDGDRQVIVACGRRVLVVGPPDAEGHGLAPDALAGEWLAALRTAFAAEKEVEYSSRLLRRALLGLVLPAAFLGAALLLSLVSRRLRARLLETGEDVGFRVGGLHLLGSRVERTGAAHAVRLVTWVGYAVLAYLFIAVLFQQFPATRLWAARLLAPFSTASSEIGQWIPVLGLVLICGIALRVVLLFFDRLFAQVRAGRVRLEPFLSPESAGPTEFAARAAAVIGALLFVAWVVPGELGLVLEGAMAIAALALGAGGWDACANLVAGFVSLYGRPVHRGRAVRIGPVAGILREKGLLYLRIETSTGRKVLVPNRRLLCDPVEDLAVPERLVLRLWLRAVGGTAVAVGLVRHATATIGRRREEARVSLVAVREGALALDADWPTEGEEPGDLRHRLIEALLGCADRLEVEIVSIETPPPAES